MQVNVMRVFMNTCLNAMLMDNGPDWLPSTGKLANRVPV